MAAVNMVPAAVVRRMAEVSSGPAGRARMTFVELLKALLYRPIARPALCHRSSREARQGLVCVRWPQGTVPGLPGQMP